MIEASAPLEPARRPRGRLLGALAGLVALGAMAAGAAYGWARWREPSATGGSLASAAGPVAAAPPAAPLPAEAPADPEPAPAAAIEPAEAAANDDAPPVEAPEALAAPDFEPEPPGSELEPSPPSTAAPPWAEPSSAPAPGAPPPSAEPGSAPERAPARSAERGTPRGALFDPEAEEARLRALLAADPDDADARVALAALLESRGDRAGADALLAELERSPAESDEARRLRRIDALARLGRTDEARAELDALSPSARASEPARIGAARVALAEGRPDDAVRELAPLAESETASAAVRALYARALAAAGRPAEASQAYAASAAEDPTLPEALLGRAEAAVRSRRPDDALRTLRRLHRALESEPRPPAFRARAEFVRGRALLMAGRRADARRTLAAVVARPDAPTEAWFFLAESRVGADYRGARDAYLRYLELSPNGYYARRARHALGIAR